MKIFYALKRQLRVGSVLSIIVAVVVLASMMSFSITASSFIPRVLLHPFALLLQSFCLLLLFCVGCILQIRCKS